MTEAGFKLILDRDPFTPLRLHLVSRKTLDVLRHDAACPLRNIVLVLRNPSMTGSGGESFDSVSYQNIERIEPLDAGKRVDQKKRKPA